jgi:type I restriction enzyme S subunit
VSKSWNSAPLEDLASFRSGLWKGKKGPFTTAKVIRNTNIRKHGYLSLDDVAEIEVETKQLETRRLQKGDIILERSGGGPKQAVGRAVFFDIDGDNFSFSNFTSFIRIHDLSRISNRFMHLVLNWWYETGVTEKIQSNSTGIRNLDFNAYKTLEVPLPPLEEQQRIVALLDEAFEGLARARAHAEANLQNAQELFESFRDQLIGVGRPNWKEAPLSDFLERITYGFTNPMPDAESGPFKVTAKNVINGVVDLGTARKTTAEAFADLLTDKSRPKIGDVLLTKDGTLGRTAVVETAGICVNQSVAVLSPATKVRSHYLHEMLSCKSKQESMIADAGGATIKHLYITRVPKIIVQVPDLKEQDELLEALAKFKCDVAILISNSQKKLADLDDLRQSLLQKAFTGELT